MAMNNLGRVAMVHRGDYSPTYDYKPLDCCYHDGSTYFCKAATTGNAPPNTTYWVLMSTSASTVDRDAAEAAAQAAASSATSAANQVTLAEEQVTLAQGHANTASTKATAAAGSASAAANSAGEALASAGNAALSASAAAQSAAAAADSAALVDMTNYALKTQITNPNILHNWDFRNPVNQRGVSGVLPAGYGIDRWTANFNPPTLSSEGITLNGGSSFYQRLENHVAYRGMTLTVSVKAGSNAASALRVFDGTGYVVNFTIAANSITSDTFVFPSNSTDMRVEFRQTGASDVTVVESVKLEVGDFSTLAHDPPMDHAVELPKCQRFFTGLKNMEFSGIFTSTSALRAAIILPVTMRITPSVAAYTARINTKTYGNGGNPVSLGWVSGTASSNGGAIIATASDALYGVSAGDPGALTLTDSMFIEFSADL